MWRKNTKIQQESWKAIIWETWSCFMSKHRNTLGQSTCWKSLHSDVCMCTCTHVQTHARTCLSCFCHPQRPNHWLEYSRTEGQTRFQLWSWKEQNKPLHLGAQLVILNRCGFSSGVQCGSAGICQQPTPRDYNKILWKNSTNVKLFAVIFKIPPQWRP